MSDPNFANVGLLLHCNGTDASTSFPDSSSNAHTVTAVGNAQVVTAQSKWGGASANFDGPSGTGGGLSVPFASSIDIGSGDFTVEFWLRFFYPPSSYSSAWLISQPASSTPGVLDQWSIWATKAGPNYRIAFQAISPSDTNIAAGTHGVNLTNATWYHVALTRSGSTFRLFVDGASPVSVSGAGAMKTVSHALIIGRNAAATSKHAGWIDDIRITKGVARYTSAFSPPTAEFEEGGYQAWLAADSMLGAVALLGGAGRFAVRLADASLLGAPAAVGFTDWTALLAPVQPVQFVLDLVTTGGTVRVPISSWQATLTTDGQCYAACVVPACLAWVSTLEAATEFVVSRRAELASGLVMYVPAVRCQLQTLQVDQGPVNATASLSGYFDQIDAVDNPPAKYDRTLQGVRSISSYVSGARVRCDIDWLLRPGQRAFYAATSMVVDYINFYATSEGSAVQAYMDVGERV